MSKKKIPHFKVSTALKTIIGKDLITDDFIAVFELVKNAFDAHARRVDIEFKDTNGESPTLIIKDNGKGMDRRDITSKWLFVAYSAKKHGKDDYRDRISSRRVKAGSKGIGRFSCDKLGAKLTMYSRKSTSGSYQKVDIDWGSFEKDDQKEIGTVPVKLSTVQTVPVDLKKGTALVIAGLREPWDRDKFLKLRKSLEKLINPNQSNDDKRFAIYLSVPDENDRDREVKESKPWDVVNGKIENVIFEDLGIRTTKIEVIISPDGGHVTTTLEDRGTKIYSITEVNPHKKLLQNISVYLFVLNRSAKNYFTRRMGVRAVNFGSVFLFKNGFRVYPFGDVGEDTLGINQRKQQGQSRYLGTRDLIGRIEINGANESFRETSSRDGGLVKNEAYQALRSFFISHCIRRLERYAIGVIKWGNTIDLDNLDESNSYDVKSKVFEIIQSLTDSEDVIDIDYDSRFLDIYQNISETSVATLLKNFQRIAGESGNESLAKEARRAERHLKQLRKAIEEAEAAAEKAQARAEEEAEKAAEAEERAREAAEETRKFEAEAKRQQSQNLFLQSVISEDLKHVVSLHHHIGIAADTIQNSVKEVSRRVSKGKPLTTEYVQSILARISYQARKIETTTRFATKANFTLSATEMEGDLAEFIREYIQNVHGDVLTTPQGQSIEISCIDHSDISFVTKYRPLEITIIIDNLVSNSRKAGSTAIRFTLNNAEESVLQLTVQDNGKGISEKNSAKLFDFGFTTTNGSGLGLYHIRKLLDDAGGSITVNTDYRKGAEFTLCFSK